MIKLLLHKSKRHVGSPGVFITPGTYFIAIICIESILFLESVCLFFTDPKSVGQVLSRSGGFNGYSR